MHIDYLSVSYFALLHVLPYFYTLQDVLIHEFPHHLHAPCYSVLEFMVYFAATHTGIPYCGHKIYVALHVHSPILANCDSLHHLAKTFVRKQCPEHK